MLFSILICTIDCRRAFYDRLMARLEPQLTEGVEIVTANDNGDAPIGGKRCELLAAAAGKYVAFVDDDDVVSADYVSRIVPELAADVDCVGFKVRRFTDGKQIGEAIHRLDAGRYWTDDARGRITFWRTPNHLNPVRAELARRVGFKPANWGEDRDYSERLFPLLKSERFVDAYLYDYLYRSPPQRCDEVVNEVPPVVRAWKQFMRAKATREGVTV